jgi:hypothetical protein
VGDRLDVRLNVWSPLEAPWDTPMSTDDQDMFAMSAVISGSEPTDSAVVGLLSDQPGLFVAAQRNVFVR